MFYGPMAWRPPLSKDFGPFGNGGNVRNGEWPELPAIFRWEPGKRDWDPGKWPGDADKWPEDAGRCDWDPNKVFWDAWAGFRDPEDAFSFMFPATDLAIGPVTDPAIGPATDSAIGPEIDPEIDPATDPVAGSRGEEGFCLAAA